MLVNNIIKKRRKNQEEKTRNALTQKTGIYFSVELEAQPRQFPTLKYVLNALILFGATYGSLMCFTSSFDMEIYHLFFGVICAFLAVIFSAMYIYKWTKYVAYVAILFMCIFFLGQSYQAINSGMSAIFNICLEQINEVFPLPMLRDYTEYISDRAFTITMALCVIALLIMMLLNIFVSEYMNAFAVFLITFPLVSFGIYFGFQVAAFPAILVMGSWILVLVMKMTGAYDGLSHKMDTKTAIKKNVHQYGFVTDPGNCASIGATIGVVVLVFFLALNIFIPKKDFAISTFADQWKMMTNQPVKNVLTYGVYALFPNNREKEAPGQIANRKSISFDGKTDLEVTMADYGANRIYLRSFTGQRYIPYGYKWINGAELQTKTISFGKFDTEEAYMSYNLPASVLQYNMEHEKDLLVLEHKIEIKIVDAGLLKQKDLLVPYYSVINNQEYNLLSAGQLHNVEEKDTNTYIAYSVNADISDRNLFSAYADIIQDEVLLQTQKIENDYYEAVIQNVYLTVPEANREVIAKFCGEHDLRSDDPDVINKVITVLKEEYTYTIRPGRVPGNEEYVNYFLAVNKKGYCVHFATSATLIFRYLGIPARYVEGYVVDWSDFASGKVLDEKPSDWLKGGTTDQLQVVKAEVTDANGHAWVEIYYPEFGWVPVEVTNSASDDSEGGNSLLAGIFGGGASLASALENSMNQIDAENIQKTARNMKNSGVILVVLMLLAYLTRMTMRVLPRKLKFAKEDKKLNPFPRYQHIQQILDFIWGNDRGIRSYREFSEDMEKQQILSKEEGDELLKNIEYLMYSRNEKGQEQYLRVKELLQKCRKMIVRRMKLRSKIRFYLWKNLW